MQGLVAGRFEIEAHAGQGGMGSVYRARDREGGEVVALKVVPSPGQEASQRFVREARVLAQLDHPGVVRYVAHGLTPEGLPWLAMEWLEGEDLAHRLAREPLPVDDTLRLGIRVAEALAAAHARGIVHRDIKPGNLFLPGGEVGRAKVLDFGIARAAGLGNLTRTGAMIGTPAYMAPEQARGDRDVGARCDIFALGCVLYECLTGKAAFAGAHPMAVMAKVLFEEAPRLAELRPELPAALDGLLAQLLAKDPAARPGDAAEVARALAALQGATGAAPAPAAARAALTGSERRLVCLVLAAPDPSSDALSPTLVDSAPAIADTMAASHTGTGPDLGLLRATAERHGAVLERLRDGTLAALITGAGSASDLALRAARCALGLRAQLPDAPMALATGRAVAGRAPVGEVIERAAALLAVRGAGVPLDDVTAGLLDARFDVGGERTLVLRGEREAADTQRRLLGRATPCVGRERELTTLEAFFAECVDEPVARAVLITGPAGIGKSRVRYELLPRLRARAPEAEIWLARGDAMRAGSPFGMLAEALRRAAGMMGGQPPTLRQARLRARVGRHVTPADAARVAEFLGELTGEPFPDQGRVELASARQDPALMGDQIRRAFEDFLAAETAAGPVVIVLEDLRFGDLPSMRLLDGALRVLADRPLLVIGLGRPEVHDLFPALWSERGVQEIRLGELTRKACEKLIAAALPGCPPERAQRLVERAGGNAFYLEELIRAAAEGADATLPATVLAMVQARLEALPDDARRVLRAASVFGQTFWQRGVEHLVGEPLGATVGEWLTHLVGREVVTARAESRFAGEREHTFRSALVHEAAYAMLTDHDRALGHRLAGAWLSEHGERDALALAEHFERGGDPARAAVEYTRAARDGLEGNDFRAAIQRGERAEACGAAGPELGTVRMVQAEAWRWLGETARSVEASEQSIGLLSPGTPPWYEAVVKTASLQRMAGRPQRALELVAELRAAGITRDPVALRAWGNACAQMHQLGRHDEGDRMLEQVATVGAIEDPLALAWFHRAKGLSAHFHGRVEGFLTECQAALEGWQRAADTRRAIDESLNLGYALSEIGDLDNAERCLRAAAASAERLGLPAARAGAHQNLGLVLLRRGRLEEARAEQAAGAALFAAQTNPRMEGISRSYLGRALLGLGDPVGAERETRRAVELLAVNPPYRPLALAALSEVLLARGDAAGALAAADEAARIAAELGGIEEGVALVGLAQAAALRAAGRDQEAREALARTGEQVRALAARIEDPALRRGFLEQVPENRSVLESLA